MDDPKSTGSRDKVGSGGPQGIGAPAKGDSSASNVPANELENSATLADSSISPTPPPKSAPKPLTGVSGDGTYVDDGRTSLRATAILAFTSKMPFFALAMSSVAVMKSCISWVKVAWAPSTKLTTAKLTAMLR